MILNVLKHKFNINESIINMINLQALIFLVNKISQKYHQEIEQLINLRMLNLSY